MTKLKHPKLHNPIEKQFNDITRFHYFLFFLLFSSKLPIFWHILNLIFLSPPIDYICHDGSKNSTKNLCPCDVPIWDRSVFLETMQSKFGLHCNKYWLINFSHCINFLGLLIGGLVFGFLSDKFGRLKMYVTSCSILGVTGCLLTVMPTIAAFTLMRFLEGVGSGGAIITGYVLCIEYCGLRHREVITALYHVPINLSHITLPVVSYLWRHFDHFQLAISIPIFLFIFVWWLAMESPKWLMDNDDIDKAVDVMEKYGKFNGKPCENIREQIEEFLDHHSNKSRRHMKFWEIFKHKTLSINLGCMSVVYFLCGIGYYGVSQMIGKMSGNIHINVTVSGAMLLPGTIASIFLLKLLNRRTFLMSTIFFSGLFMVIAVCIPFHLSWLRVLIACICNCFFFMSFIIVFLYGVELFPTSVRNSALGFLSFLSRVGQIAAPLVNDLHETTSGIIFGVLALLGTVLCYLLPETKNVELPSSLDDTKVLGRKKVLLEDDDNITINSPMQIS
ncbi:solute carrier family 22 member 3-like [Leptidea sinapis]|uniref:solute carrier family 22 member 3-like n=1 Tax=Leptidea sinapis TaxID=189913 RepID=UPI002144201A|nr:solute carrier family 22 member 3-like [Leptidea sinapis]